MIIREMEEKDLETASSVCMDAFLGSVAGELSAEGVSTFSAIAAADAFLKRMNDDTLMLVAECDATVVGVIELKEGRHLSMLFVKPEQQRKGIGQMLVLSALSFAKVDTVTVKASLSSVSAYERFGFVKTGDIDEVAGLVFQPMECHLR